MLHYADVFEFQENAKRRITSLLLMLAALFCFAGFAAAQSSSGSAALQGKVVDPSGLPVPGATVALVNQETGYRRSTATLEDGHFATTAVPVGRYRLEVSAQGFKASATEEFQLEVGENKGIDIRLSIEAVQEQVTVTATAEVVNRQDISNSVTINERAIENLPIRGRNFQEFVQLSPNTTQESNRGGIVINGQRSINSNISIDGVDNNDPLQNGPRGGGPKEAAFSFPQSAVREFQVVLNGASAEVGRTNAGYINVVTKSGTNNYHGEGFYLNRNGTLTSPDAFDNSSSSNKQHQFGGSFGGPIRKDKTFFFGAVEKNIVNIPYTVKFDSTPAGTPKSILDQQGNFVENNNPLVAFGRLDYQLNNNNTVNFQYNYAAQSGLNFGGVSGQTNVASSNNTILARTSQGVKGGFTTVFSPSLLNELRGQWYYDNHTETPQARTAAIDITGFGTIGGNADGTFIYNSKRIQLLDNVSWTRGIHSLKFGGDMNFTPTRMQREKNYGGDYSFNSMADYLAALAGDHSKIARYVQTIAANGKQGLYDGRQQEFALFLTDTMKLRPDLTLTAGFRWEGQMNPQFPVNPAHPLNGPIPNDWKMWQPRLGVVYDIGGKGTSVIRLSGGIFDSRTPAYLMHRIFTDNGINTVFLDSAVDPNVLNFLTLPNALTSVPAAVAGTSANAIYAYDPTFRNPRSGQVAIAFEQQLDHSTKVTIGFTRNSTWALQRRVDINLFPPTLIYGFPIYPTQDAAGNLVPASGFSATGAPVFIDSKGNSVKAVITRPDPTVGQFNVNKSVGHASYNGLYISLQRRMSRRIQFGANYTYSKNRDDDSNERDYNRQYELNTFNLNGDAAYAKNDMRHSGNFNVLYDLGHGFTVSTLMIAHTGTPGRYVLTSDIQNDGNKDNDRPILNGFVVPRDSTRLPNFFDWDLRLTKEFKIGEGKSIVLTAEGFNLTRASNKSFNSDGDSAFGKPVSFNATTGVFTYANQVGNGKTAGVPLNSPGTDRFGGPRQAQLGVRVVF